MFFEKYENYRYLISVVLFFLSLCFPGFYVGLDQEPYSNFALHLLLLGWLGFLSADFSWHANPLILASYFFYKSRPKLSVVLSLLSLLLALSFLLHSKILVNEGGGTDKITSYGFGYFLWVTSIFIFFSSNLIDCCKFELKYPKVNIHKLYIFKHMVILIGSLIFAIHFFVGESSHFRIVYDRAVFFNENCDKAKDEIYEYARNVTGVYFGSGVYAVTGRLEGYLSNGYLEFYETNNDKPGRPYLRFTKQNNKGFEVDNLQSEYSVIAENLTKNLRNALAIHGAEVLIVENNTKKTMARKIWFLAVSSG